MGFTPIERSSRRYSETVPLSSSTAIGKRGPVTARKVTGCEFFPSIIAPIAIEVDPPLKVGSPACVIHGGHRDTRLGAGNQRRYKRYTIFIISTSTKPCSATRQAEGMIITATAGQTGSRSRGAIPFGIDTVP